MLTVERALAVLYALADSTGELGNNEIARLTGTNPSTASRLLATLAEDGLVSRVDETGRFRLGPRLVELGNAALAQVDIRQAARPHLAALTEAIGETSTLSVPYGEATITVDFVQSSSSVRSVAQVGRPSVTHATATGKVFLAHRGDIPPGRLASYTRHTITDRAALRREIASVAEKGWARAIGEREEDLNAIAAPILGTGGQLVAVLGVQGPAYRFGPRAMLSATGELVDRATQLSTYQGP